MRLPKDTALDQVDWLRDSTSPSWTKFAAFWSIQTWPPSSGLVLHIMQCSSTIISPIPLSITTRVQVMLMKTHPIFRSSTSSGVFVVLFDRESSYISWRKDQQKDSFLELILRGTSWLCSKHCEGLRGQLAFYRRKSNSRSLPRRGTTPLKIFGSYDYNSWGLSRPTSRAQRKKIYCRLYSCKNASASRSRTGRSLINGLSMICLLEEHQYAVIGKTRLTRTNTELYTTSRVAWWQKYISRSQELTIMTPSCLLETKLFSDSSLLLPCILDVDFFTWTSTQLFPEGFDDGSDLVCLLQKCINGLRE